MLLRVPTTLRGCLSRVAILVVGAFSIAGYEVPALGAQEPELHMVLNGHTQLVTSVATAPSGDLLVSGSLSGTMKIWDLATGSERLTLDGHGARIWWVEFLDEGQTVASGDAKGNIKLWNLARGTETTSIAPSGASSFRFSIHGTLLAHNEGARVILTDLTSGEDRLILSRPAPDDVSWVWGFAAQGRTLVGPARLLAYCLVSWTTEGMVVR